MTFLTLPQHPLGRSQQPFGLDYASAGDPSHPAVMLVMGLGTQRTAWPEELIQALVDQGYRVVSFDNRDVGLSTQLNHLRAPHLPWALLRTLMGMRVPSPYSLTDMAQDALALMDALGIAKAHVVGASMGGMIAQLMAVQAPQRILSLTSIMSTTGRRGLPGPTPAARRRLMTRPPRHATPEQIAEHFLQTFKVIGSPQSTETDQSLYQRLLESVKRAYNPAGTLRQLAAILADGSRVKRLATLKVPTLVLHGEADPLIPIACGRDTADCITGAQFVAIKGMGHDFAPGPLADLTSALLKFLTHQRQNEMPAGVPR